MNENKNVARLYVFLTVVISAVAVMFQYILYGSYIEAETGLYIQGAKTPLAFYLFIFVAVVLTATPAFVLRRDLLPNNLTRGTVPTAIASLMSAVAVAFSGVVFFMGRNNISVTGSASETIEKLKFACSILAFVVAIYYFAVVFSGKTKSDFVSFLSFFPVIWTLLFLMCMYFDHSGVINSPVKVFRQLALIVFMVYQLFETRASLGKSKPVIYFILSNLAVIFLSAAFVPEIILLIKGTVELSLDTVYAVYCGVAAIYVLTRSMAFAESSNGDKVVKKKKVLQKSKPNDDLFTPDEDSE